jgi:hypothetical protein
VRELQLGGYTTLSGGSHTQLTVRISRRFIIKNTRVVIFGKTDSKHSEQENNRATQEIIIQT